MQIVIEMDECIGCCTLPCLTGAQFFCRQQECSASLCGFSEFLAGSTPPKKYRTYSISGNDKLESWFDPDCVDAPLITAESILSGSAFYPLGSCEMTNNLKIEYYINGDKVSEETPSPDPVTSCPTNTDLRSYSCNLGQLECAGTNVCVSSSKASGSYTYILTNLDTYAAGASRSEDCDAWGDWIQVGGSPLCEASNCCLCGLTEQTDFDFTYKKADYKVYKAGLTPGVKYNTYIGIYRNFGDGFELYATVEAEGTVDGYGVFEITEAVEFSWDYPTYAAPLACP